MHDVAGPQLRGLGIGIYFFTVNVVAYGVGAPLVGRLDDLSGAQAAPSMRRYSLLVRPLACLLAAFLLWRGSRKMKE